MFMTVKCHFENCNKISAFNKPKNKKISYCGIHYIELFMPRLNKLPRIKNKIAGRLCHNRHIA